MMTLHQNLGLSPKSIFYDCSHDHHQCISCFFDIIITFTTTIIIIRLINGRYQLVLSRCYEATTQAVIWSQLCSILIHRGITALLCSVSYFSFPVLCSVSYIGFPVLCTVQCASVYHPHIVHTLSSDHSSLASRYITSFFIRYCNFTQFSAI